MLNSEAPVRIPTTFASGQGAVAEDRERHQRRLRAELDCDEHGDQAERQRQEADRLARAPAGVGRLDQRVDQDRETGGDADRAPGVEVPGLGLGPALEDQARGDERRGDPDREVDPQDPLPADVLGEDAAEQDARGATGSGDRAPHAQRLVALGAVGEGGRDDRQRRRREQRGAHALNGAGGDQRRLGLGEPADQRREREQDEPADEDPAAAEEVGKPAAEEQEAAEGQDVGVDDPGEVVLGEVESARRWSAARRSRSRRRGRRRTARCRAARARSSASLCIPVRSVIASLLPFCA